MRCKNCGWENMDGTARCEKCGSPLTVSANDATVYSGYSEPNEQPMTEPMTATLELGGTVTDGQQCTPPPYTGDVMSTVREKAPYTVPAPTPEPEWRPEPIVETPAAISSNCTVCGYPLTEDISECPNCKTPVAGKKPEEAPVVTPAEAAPLPESAATPAEGLTCPSCGARVGADARFCASCGSSVMQQAAEESFGTPHINRVTMGTVRNATVLPGFSELPPQPPKPVHYCTLRRREWPGEMVKYTPTTYSGDSVVLNRMNTDQHNNTITSKQQAVITCEDGQWYIEDRSTLQSTYVRVTGKVPIKAGDIILLGNREFEFEGF